MTDSYQGWPKKDILAYFHRGSSKEISQFYTLKLELCQLYAEVGIKNPICLIYCLLQQMYLDTFFFFFKGNVLQSLITAK